MGHHKDREHEHEHKRREAQELSKLTEIARELRSIVRELRQIISLLTKTKAVTTVIDLSGDINMAQTTYTSQSGTSTLTFKTIDSVGDDITSRCSYTVTSDGAAMVPGTVTGNTVSVAKTPGAANLTIKTTDESRGTIPDVVLACTIVAPPPPPPPPPPTAETTVSDSDPTATIS